MWFFFYSVSHSWGVPTMKMTDLSILCKRETLKNRQFIKYLFAPLYVVYYFVVFINILNQLSYRRVY